MKSKQASQVTDEQARIEAALKQAAAHAHRQLAAQGLKLPTQDWKHGTISNPVDTKLKTCTNQTPY